MRTTYMAKSQTVTRSWYLVDAKGKTLGRLASKIAQILRGKHKPTYTPHVDTGDFVVVINAEKIHLTGRKMQDKLYHYHTQYPGGLKVRTASQLLDKKPTKVLELAIKGMLPHNRLARQMIKKLKIYSGTEHPHEAQQPEALEL